MLNHDHGVALLDQAVEHAHEHAYILKMQSCGRLVKDVERMAGVTFGKLGGQLDTLALTARYGS